MKTEGLKSRQPHRSSGTVDGSLVTWSLRSVIFSMVRLTSGPEVHCDEGMGSLRAKATNTAWDHSSFLHGL